MNNDDNNSVDVYNLDLFHILFYPVYVTNSNLIRVICDYSENKNKLNDEEYKYSIEKIEKIEKIEECQICLSEYNTQIKLKKCNHVFCENCIYNWLKNYKNTCPVCRVNVIINSVNPNDTNDMKDLNK